MSAANVDLINAVAAANPNTIVVINNDNPVDTSWIGSAKAVLDMWFAGQEGGTSTARILLGLANPSGHTALTWPANRTDTIWGYNEPAGALYPGSTAGQHLERLNGNAGCGGTGNPGSLACPAADGTTESEGIYTGYRYFDKLGITPRFPFGCGPVVHDFAFSNLKVAPTTDGGQDVTFTLKNTGSVAGADAVQVYVGPPSDAPAGIQFAVRSLAQFDRVELEPGPVEDGDAPRPGASALVLVREASSSGCSTPAAARSGSATPTRRRACRCRRRSGGANGNITCSNEQLNATTINGNLTVPKGSWCDLVDVTVNGNVQVTSGSGVRLAGSTVTGNLQLTDTAGAGGRDELGRERRSATPRSTATCRSRAAPPARRGTSAPAGPTTVGGNLQFTDNAGTGNTISHTTVQRQPAVHGQPRRDRERQHGQRQPPGAVRGSRRSVTRRRRTLSTATGRRLASARRLPLLLRCRSSPLAARRAAAATSSATDATTVGCAGQRPSVLESPAQKVTFAQVKAAIDDLYRAHPDIGSFTVQDVQYNATTRDKVLDVCRRGGAGVRSGVTRVGEGRRLRAADLLLLRVRAQKSAVPASIAVARKLYWYAADEHPRAVRPEDSLDGLLRSWGVP